MRTLFHGSRTEVEYPKIQIQKFHKGTTDLIPPMIEHVIE